MATPSSRNIGGSGVEILVCCQTNFTSRLEPKPTRAGNRRFRFALGKQILAEALMKQAGCMVAAGLVALAVAGCGARNQPPKVVAEQLQKSFQKADASVTAEIVQASTALQASDY